MKKLVLLCKFLFIVTYSFSQHPCGNHLNWDWTQADNYDYAYISGVGRINISSPFNTESSASSDITYIIQAKDYLPEQGWVLLDKVFGCTKQYAQTTYPYFILYNKYKGIVRLFVFNNSGLQHRQAIVTFSWLDNANRTSLLSTQNIYSFANDKYYPNILSFDKGLNHVQDYYSSAWLVTDFVVTFDNNTDHAKDYFMEFKVFSDVEADIELSGEFEFSTKSIDGTEQNKDVKDNKAYKYLEEGKKFVGKIPTSSDLKKNFDKINNALDTLNWKSAKKLATKLENANKSLQNGKIKDFLLGAADVASAMNGGLGVIVSVLDVFIGKSNSKALQAVKIQPTVSNGTIDMSGIITTKTNSSRYSLQLPGTNHQYTDNTYNYDGLPVYDCPLGVIGLEKTPVLYRKTLHSFDHLISVIGSLDRVPGYNRYYNYRVNDNIVIAVNAAAKVKIISAKAQLIGKVGSINGKPAYKLNSPHLGNLYLRDSFDPRDMPVLVPNLIVKPIVKPFLDNGTYPIVEKDKNGFDKFATPFIDIDKFRNTSFIVEENTELFLKIMVILEPTESDADQTPIIISNTYVLDHFYNDSEPYIRYPFTNEQLVEKEKTKIVVTSKNANQNISGDIIQTSGDILVNANVIYSANGSVELNPGFSVAEGTTFTAGSNRGYSGVNALHVNTYFQDCNCYPNLKSSKLNNNSNYNNESSNDELQMSFKLYPNPASNRLNIFIGNTSSTQSKIIITDIQGKMVYDNIINGYNYLLDISSFNEGVYNIRVFNKNESVTQKFIKR